MAARILVVDDNPDILNLLEILLEGEGYVVNSSPTAEKAEEIARALPPDLAIVDVGLPGMRGYELVRRLRRYDYVIKPFNLNDLMTKAAAILKLS